MQIESNELVNSQSPVIYSAASDADAPAQADSQISEFDVAVIGAGPLGILYASWLKQERPQLRILVLDRNLTPKHKIGESTLSGFCKAMRSVGIRHEAMQRLFFSKNGLGFFYGDKNDREITQASEYILETFDETFQVERRVLDSLLIANARRLGVEIIQNARVKPRESTFSQNGNLLTYCCDSKTHFIRAKLIADASGSASVLGQYFSLYTSEGKTFQTSSVWAYFKNVRWLNDYQGWTGCSQFSRDQYTQHICFREGWMWYIPLISWQQAPDENLTAMLEKLLEPEGELPNREQLSKEFQCPTTNIFSIGLALREDRDTKLESGSEAVFEHYQREIPIIGQVLKGASRLSNYYENHRPYGIRKQFRRHAQQVAGDGWLLLGDAAFFVDPLISPGLTGGTATAYFAVGETLKALDSNNFERSSFVSYESFVSTLHAALERDNQLVYMSFNHPESIKLIQRFQEIYARLHFNRYQEQSYGIQDTNVWGILDEKYQEMQKSLWEIMREEECRVSTQVPIQQQTVQLYERMVERLQLYLSPYLNQHLDLTPYIKQNRRIGRSSCFSD